MTGRLTRLPGVNRAAPAIPGSGPACSVAYYCRWEHRPARFPAIRRTDPGPRPDADRRARRRSRRPSCLRVRRYVRRLSCWRARPNDRRPAASNQHPTRARWPVGGAPAVHFVTPHSADAACSAAARRASRATVPSVAPSRACALRRPSRVDRAMGRRACVVAPASTGPEPQKQP